MSDQSSGSVPEGVNRGMQTGVHATLGISVVEASPDRVVVELPVTSRVHQPYGIVHGGVSALLAESAASIGSGVSAPPDHKVVGIELNASHLRTVRDGVLRATAVPARKGRRVQVWNVTLTNSVGQKTCEARCTLLVLPPEHQP